MFNKKYISLIITILLVSSFAQAQNQAFLFTLTPLKHAANSAFLRYEAAYGQKTFEPISVDDFEQNAGFQGNIGKYLTTTDHLGMAFTNGETKISYQTELLANILNDDNNKIIDFTAGLGFLHEYSGTNVLISRVIIGRQFTSCQAYGNLIFEHAFSTGRDPIDFTTTVGFSYNLYDNLRLGLEAVGQDLEGFWDTDEAEGGATMYFGPSLNLTFPGIALNVTFGGGEIIRATHSIRNSEAMRELPYGKGNGFIFRNVISLGL